MKPQNTWAERHEMHKWPAWKWLLFGGAIFILLLTAIFASIVTFGGGAVAIMAAAGGASFTSAISAGWATCASVLTNVGFMTAMSTFVGFVESCLLWVLKKCSDNDAKPSAGAPGGKANKNTTQPPLLGSSDSAIKQNLPSFSKKEKPAQPTHPRTRPDTRAATPQDQTSDNSGFRIR